MPRWGSCTNSGTTAQVATFIAWREAITVPSSPEVLQGASRAASAHILPQHGQGLPVQRAASLADAQLAVGSH